MFDHYRMREQLTRKIGLLKEFIKESSKAMHFSIKEFDLCPEKIKNAEIITRTILLFIAKNFSSEEISYISNDTNMSRVSAIIFEDKIADEHLLSVVGQFISPRGVCGFIGVYYNIKNGKIFYVDPMFNIDFSKSYKEVGEQFISEKNRIVYPFFDDIPLIITADGKCMLALGYHSTLSKWLRYNGTNLENAIRFRIFYKNSGCFNIESDENTANLILHNDEKKFVSALTDEQVKKIIQIYNICIQNNKHFLGLEEILSSYSKVSGIGFDGLSYKAKKIVDDKTIDITKHNINAFAECRDFFNKRKFEKILREFYKPSEFED